MKVKRLAAAMLMLCMGLGCSITAAAKEEGKVITVKHPGEGEDASPAIQAAIKKAERVDGPVTIQFEQGKQYEVWPETSYHTTGYYISNSATRGENPNGERWSAILLKDMKDVTVDGNNSLLMVHGVMTPVLIDESENITFKNFNLDYARPTVSEFTVIEKGDSYVKVKVHQDSLFELQDINGDGKSDNIRWVGEETKSDKSKRYWNSNATLMQELNPENETLRRIGMNGWGRSISDLGDNVLQFEFPGGSNYQEGFTYQVRDGIRNQVGTFIHKSKDVTFEDSKLHYLHGLGIVGQYSENLTFTRIECAPREGTGRTCAGFADFMQISGCKGEVVVTDSRFSGNHDDTFNIHGTHLRVVEKDQGANKIKVRFMQPQSWGFQAFEKGDEIEFIDGNSLNPYGKNTVKSFKRINDTDIELIMEEPLSTEVKVNVDAVENITWTPNVTIKNNISEYVPTRGVLCTTRGKVLIEGNTFKKQGMAAILLEDDARGWFESGLISDMTIKNNVFEDCVTPQIHSNPQVASVNPEKTVHSNLNIIGNTFTGRKVNITAISTKNFAVEGNQFPEAGADINLNGCNGFAVNNNTNQSKVYAVNSINERSLDSLTIESVVESEEVAREGMKASANSEWPGDGGSNPAFPAQYLLDGDESTFWSTDWEKVPEEDIYVEIDLNGKKQFNQISYLPRVNENNARILKYEIHANNAEGKYQKIAEGAWSDTSEVKYADFDTVETDKIKLVVKETSMSWDNKKVVMGAELGFYNSNSSIGELPIGKSARLNISATGITGMQADLSGAEFVYASSDESVAGVDEKGIITAKGQGTAEITVTVTAYGKSLSQTVSVSVSGEQYTAAESIKIHEVSETASSEIQMSADVVPENAMQDVLWKVNTVSSPTGAKASIDENTGILKMNGEGRVEITAYSRNNPEIKDTVSILFNKEKVETTKVWEWVRENPAAWSVDDNGNLNITLERAAIWAENSAKNILLTPVEKEDYEVVAKMNFKPQEDYTEAGIVMYADDSNYVVLSRKVHPGYRANGRNIFSLIARVDGKPWESPAEAVVADDAGASVYLKLKKEGNKYSGYFSEDGSSWTAVYENREADLGGTPKAGILGYVAGGRTENAVYEELSVDGENYPLAELKTITSAKKAEITEIKAANARKVVTGTAFESVRLPKTVNVVWNDAYEESVPVTWSAEGYNKDEVGTYTLKGTIRETAADAPSVDIVVIADKTELAKAIQTANTKVKTIYTEESWNAFEEVLIRSIAAQEKDETSQQEIDELTKELKDAMTNLESLATYEALKTMIGEADKKLEDTKEMLYKEEQPEEERMNGYFSEEKYTALLNASGTAKELENEFKELEELGDVDTLLTEEEKNRIVEGTKALIAEFEAFTNSETQVATENLRALLEDAKQLVESNFTADTWNALQEVLNKAEGILKGEAYTKQSISQTENEVTEAMEHLKRIYTVEIINTVGGSVTTDAGAAVEDGGSVTFQVIPDAGYKFVKMTINEEEVEVTEGTYTIEEVRSNIVAEAKFQLIEEGGGTDPNPDDEGNGGSDTKPDTNPDTNPDNNSGKGTGGKGTDSVQTGDTQNVVGLMIILAAAAGIIAGCLIRRRRIK